MTLENQPHMRLRPATLRDVDSLATIVYEAMPLDPQWDYRYPLRKQFPEDNYGCTRIMMRAMLEDDSNVVEVVTFPSPGLSEDEEVPAALAVWTIPQDSTFARYNQGAEELRRDVNLDHKKAFRSALDSAKTEFFGDFGSDHVHLRLLATHPDFQRRGAGSLLCKWGMEKAQKLRQPVTLFASPMGRELYNFLGFEIMGNISVQVKGEDEKLSIAVMVYHFHD